MPCETDVVGPRPGRAGPGLATAGERVKPEGALRRLDVERLPDHVERLYRAALALCGSREDAEDLVQETFERVLRRPRFLRNVDDAAYLLRVLRNAHLALEQKRMRRPVTLMTSEELEWAAEGTVDHSAAALEARAAFTAIHTLSEPLREAIVAVDVVGLSYKQAARALRVREGTIMSRLFRARQRVADALDGGESAQ